jgi:hypothetical protein
LTLGGFVDPFVSGRIESQFYDNRDADLTRYLNPTVFTEALGIAKTLLTEEKDGGAWSLRLGGGFRQFLDRDARPGHDRTDEPHFERRRIEFVSDLKYPLSKDKLELARKPNVLRALHPNRTSWRASRTRTTGKLRTSAGTTPSPPTLPSM